MLFALLIIFVAIAIGLAWFLISHDRGEREPIAALWLAVAFGVGGGLLASYLEGWLIPVDNLLSGSSQGRLFAAAMSIGIIEEACKFIPLALVIYKRRFFNERTDGIIYFALAGLGFGLPENLIYTLHLGIEAGVIRLIMTPVFHAASTGLVGYALARRKVEGRSPLGVVKPLAGVMLLHGLYNYGMISGSRWYALGSVLITAGVSAALFVVFLRARREDRSIAFQPSAPVAKSADAAAALSLIFGLSGLALVYFLPAAGLLLAIGGIISGTMSRAARRRLISNAGLAFSSLAVMAGLALLAYSVGSL